MIRKNSFKLGSGGGPSQKVTIRLLDDNEVLQVDFQSHHKGQFLMDYVCRQLNIAEKDYFGLRYVDANKQRHWMDLGKSITKQLKEMTPFIVCLRFKFYPGDPMMLKENVTRYQLVLQLRRDILHGRLYSTLPDMAILSSFIIQSELGDFDPEKHTGNYVAEYELIARQTPELEEKVMELHPELKGVTASEADVRFLKKAQTLDTYGIDPHPVKSKAEKRSWLRLRIKKLKSPIASVLDQQGEQIFLGINHTGISTFQGSKKSTHFKWPQVTKLNFEAKMFIIHVSIAEDSRTKKKETVGFKCQTSSSCKYLWRCAVEQRLFFNCGSATEIPSSVRGGGIFGARFRYQGKVLREILDDPGPLRASDGVIQRTPLYRSLQRNKTRSLPHSPLQLGYGSLPRSNHSAPTEGTRIEGVLPTLGSSSSLPLASLSSPYCPDHTLPLLEVLEEDSPRDDDKQDLDKGLAESEREQSGEEASKIESASLEHGGSGDQIGNGQPFFPVSGSDGFTENSIGDKDTLLRESKIDQVSTSSSVVSRDGKSVGKPRRNILSMWKVFLVCMVCVLSALLCVAVLAIEVDVDICQRMRRIPEVELFQTVVYEPVKYFIRDKIHTAGNNLKRAFHF